MLNYKRGVVKYSFFPSNGTQYEVEEEVYHVYQNETKIGFMSNDEDLKEWFFYKNIDSDYLCGGLTLKEAKESLSRCLSSEHWNAKEVQEYFNN
jgi:hypothetical protein